MLISRGTAPEQPVEKGAKGAKHIFTNFVFFYIKFANFNQF